MRKSNFALRLQPSIMQELRAVAEAEGVAVNQLINVAIAGMLAERRGMAYMAARAALGRLHMPRAREILARAGGDNPPDPGDEWGDDEEFKAKAQRGELRYQQQGDRRREAEDAAAQRPQAAAAAVRQPQAAVAAARRSQAGPRKQRKVKR